MDILTLGETLIVTGLERKTLYRYRQANKFPAAVKISDGPAVYFRSDEVSAWCAAHGIQWPARDP